MRSQWEKVWKVSSYSVHLINISCIEVTMRKGFIEWTEYNDTFHTFSHCDLIVWSNYWEGGVRWHLSYLLSLWPHCMKHVMCHRTPSFQYIRHTVRSQWIKVWKVSSYSIPSINTSYSEVRVRWYLSYFFLIVTSLYDVLIERMEYDDTFHTAVHCDLTDWSIYWKNRVRWHLSYLFSLWPHCMKYL
jgi:hypothetical protein